MPDAIGRQVTAAPPASIVIPAQAGIFFSGHSLVSGRFLPTQE
ncbi:hypothetical protein BN1221_03762 [Brenneria goodwinii]|uniref:Uncharacterized protein n=1 Tax=Brenneria goodwinii TaxID=1109412 RepID=A0A0G4JZH6_9GAMM|nr:hypothetical protein BN1221_03762 [Brenneria goodwinii]